MQNKPWSIVSYTPEYRPMLTSLIQMYAEETWPMVEFDSPTQETNLKWAVLVENKPHAFIWLEHAPPNRTGEFSIVSRRKIIPGIGQYIFDMIFEQFSTLDVLKVAICEKNRHAIMAAKKYGFEIYGILPGCQDPQICDILMYKWRTKEMQEQANQLVCKKLQKHQTIPLQAPALTWEETMSAICQEELPTSTTTHKWGPRMHKRNLVFQVCWEVWDKLVEQIGKIIHRI